MFAHPLYGIGRLINPLEFAAANSDDGRAWITGLPETIHAVCSNWHIEITDGAVHTGYHAVVLPVRRRQENYVLKLTWPVDRAIYEARALAAWVGNGAVQLIDAEPDRGALLLEQLDASTTLLDLNLTEAASVAGRLLHRLTVPAPTGLRKLTELVRELADSIGDRQERLDRPVPNAWIETSRALARRLGEMTTDRYLVHADMHYGNVLAGKREPWLAIDPKPLAGDPEHAVPELLWTRADELEDAPSVRQLLEVIVESGDLDAEKARIWCIVRCVDACLWGIEHGLTEDPRRCQRVVQALI